jgi:hypothetical protein
MSEPGQGMLSLVACISLPVLAAWVIFSYVPSSRESILAQRLPRLRPTLRVWAVVIAILAIDFAANSLCNRYPGLVVRLDACDTVFILLSALEMIFLPGKYPRPVGASIRSGVVGYARDVLIVPWLRGTDPRLESILSGNRCVTQSVSNTTSTRYGIACHKWSAAHRPGSAGARKSGREEPEGQFSRELRSMRAALTLPGASNLGASCGPGTWRKPRRGLALIVGLCGSPALRPRRSNRRSFGRIF